MSEEIYGIVASFKDTPSLYNAAEKVRDAGFKHWDTYSSFPIHGMPEAQGQARSKVPMFTFAGNFGLDSTLFHLCLSFLTLMQLGEFKFVMR